MADEARILDAIEKWPELPLNPAQWTKSMSVHLNYGGGVGAGTYSIYDGDKMLMPFSFAYRTAGKKEPGYKGFFIEGIEGPLTWDELREYWHKFVAMHRPLGEERRNHQDAIEEERRKA